MATSRTTPVPSGDGYTRPPGLHETMTPKAAQMLRARVDRNGRPLPDQSQNTTTEVNGEVAKPRSMVEAIVNAAEAAGVIAKDLVDSRQFMLDVGRLSPADSEGIAAAVSDVIANNPSLAKSQSVMAPNRNQRGGASVPAQPAASSADRMRSLAAQALDQPTPPGSTY